MSTSLTSPGLVFAANKALIGAHRAIAKVSLFATDFSADAAQPGDTMAVEFFDTDPATEYDDDSNNYGTVNGTVKDVKVTFDHRVKKTYGYKPTDLLKASASIWTRKGDAAGISVALAIEAAVAGKINKTAVPKTGDGFSSANEKVFASVTKANLAKLRKAADDVGADPARTVLVLTPGAFADVLALFDANVYGGAEAVRNGVLPNLYGFKGVVEMRLSAAAGENLVGALVPAEALGVAGRTIPADEFDGAECGFTTDDASGLTMGTYAFVDKNTRTHKFTMEALFGAKLIQPGKCVRLVSEATA
jgi:hypothetical protein